MPLRLCERTRAFLKLRHDERSAGDVARRHDPHCLRCEIFRATINDWRDYPLLDIFVSTLYFFLFSFWITLLFHISQDIFRSHDLSGPANALWVVFIFVLPLLGCLAYLVMRGGAMHERENRALQNQQKAFKDYIRKVANQSS
jgi:hypothetical protein